MTQGPLGDLREILLRVRLRGVVVVVVVVVAVVVAVVAAVVVAAVVVVGVYGMFSPPSSGILLGVVPRVPSSSTLAHPPPSPFLHFSILLPLQHGGVDHDEEEVNWL